jgi:hypothetical protein
MVIFELRDIQMDYSVYAEVTDHGDLVVSGRDQSSWLVDRIGRGEYAYFYTVRAKHVPRLCAQLGLGDDGTDDALLAAVRALLAPHGMAASAMWRAWLQAKDVAWVSSVC